MEHAYSGMPATRLTAVQWRKSRFSNPSGNCVEIARLPDRRVAVRDSRDPGGPALIFAPAAWSAFLRAIRLAPGPHQRQ